MSERLFFALAGSEQLGARVAAQFGTALSQQEEREFAGGEHKTRALVPVVGRSAVVMHSLYGDDHHSANDKLCRLLFFLGALRDAGAARVTALVPYLAYARKDRRTKPLDPLTTQYVASLFAAMKTDGLITLGVHNPAAEENAFHCLYRDLDAARLFADDYAGRSGREPITVLAPDSGAIKGAQHFQALLQEHGLESDLAFMTKVRSQGVVTSSPLYGQVAGRRVVIFDDLISSGTTIANALEYCEGQAAGVHVAAVHGAFSPGIERLLTFQCLERIVISDSVTPPQWEEPQWQGRLECLDSSSLFAEGLQAMGC